MGITKIRVPLPLAAAALFLVMPAVISCAGSGALRSGAKTVAAVPEPPPVLSRETMTDAVPENEELPYRLGIGDVLSVTDLDHPQVFLSAPAGDPQRQTFRVRDDGTLLLPMVGAVPAAGSTVLELEETLQEEYRRFIKQPMISVTVAEYNSQRFYVVGEVTQPGAYPVDGRKTILDALGAAGGLSESADLSSSYFLRGSEPLPVDFLALMGKGDIRHNLNLRDGDIINIGSLEEKKVFVLGEVNKPGPVQLGNKPMTVIEALATAGGMDPVTADKGSVLLFKGGLADPAVYRMSMKNALAMAREAPLLEPGDRIYVTATGLATWNRVMVQLLPFLQGAQAVDDIRHNEGN